MYTNLLERQIRRHLKVDSVISPDWRSFLDAVNDSYMHYERDHLLGQRSLEISSAELNQLALEISENEQRIQALLREASDGIIVLNENNEIEICNSSAARYLGFSDIEEAIQAGAANVEVSCVDRSTEKLSKSSFADCIFHLKAGQLDELIISTKDGSEISIELSFSELVLTQKTLKICMLRDITMRKETEKKIALRHNITSLLLASQSLEEVIPKILSILCEKLHWNLAIFWLNNPDNDELKPIDFYYHKENLSENEMANIEKFISKSLQLTPMQNTWHEYLDWNRTDYLFLPDIKDNKGFLSGHEIGLCKFHSYLNIPLVFGAKLFGVIELFTPNTYVEDSQLQKILKDIGSEIGVFIDHQNTRHRAMDLQKQLVTAARESGKMQVAASVLHNVGNVLNTVNTSAIMIGEFFTNSELHNLKKIAELIKNHEDDFPEFIGKHRKGKLLLQYLDTIPEIWSNESIKISKEIGYLVEKVDHIKNIIKMQQTVNALSSLKEKVMVNYLLDDIIFMKVKDIENFKIEISKQYEELPAMLLDRNLFLQILMNLINNAIDAVKEIKEQKRITILTSICHVNHVKIQIIDNGCGINIQDLNKIFTFGFTTKLDGHGFGLHSSSLLAKEMGGNLEVESAGIGQGAVFTLTLPVSEDKQILENMILGCAANKI